MALGSITGTVSVAGVGEARPASESAIKPATNFCFTNITRLNPAYRDRPREQEPDAGERRHRQERRLERLGNLRLHHRLTRRIERRHGTRSALDHDGE